MLLKILFHEHLGAFKSCNTMIIENLVFAECNRKRYINRYFLNVTKGAHFYWIKFIDKNKIWNY